jgi:Short C-terminal domain
MTDEKDKFNPIELAKAGDCKAIDFLINQQLESRGVIARSSIHDGCLRVVLESEIAPSHEKLVAFICKGIKGLKTDVFSSLEICGKGKHNSEVEWAKKFNLKNGEARKDNTMAEEIANEPTYALELKGTNGTLIVENKKIRIIRHGGLLGSHKKGSRDILYSEIFSFQYAAPKGFTSEGFFYFQLADNVPEITRKESFLDENSVQFTNLNELQEKLLPRINRILSQNILLPDAEENFFLGDNGSLTLQDSFLTIHRNHKNLGSPSVGNKNIPYRSITAVQFHKSEKTFLGYTTGFLQLTIQGGREFQGGIISAISDENTVAFKTEEKNIEFAQAKEIIETRMRQLNDPVLSSKSMGSLDDLEKLASLKDKGIITEEEFQAKKRQILGL